MDETLSTAEFPDESGAAPVDSDSTADSLPASSAVELSDSDFLSDVPRRVPGPGILESVGWLIGVFILQALGSVIVLVFKIVEKASARGPGSSLPDAQNPEKLEQFLQSMMQDSLVELICVGQVVFLVGAILATALRLGRSRGRYLPLKGMPLPHAALVGLLMVPLIPFVNSLHWYVTQYWNLFVEYVPLLKTITENSSSMEVIGDLASRVSFPALFLLVAVVPAIAEELVFRGVIGRGLVARWGVGRGVLITTILFAVMHLNPAHVIALVPLSICIHLAYVSTRSFWAPMAIHFFNNGFAVLALYFVLNNPEMAEQAGTSEPSMPIYLASGFFVMTLSLLLWNMRVQYVRPNGEQWDPGYEGADIPPAELATAKVYSAPDQRLLVATGLSAVLFGAAVIYAFAESAAAAA